MPRVCPTDAATGLRRAAALIALALSAAATSAQQPGLALLEAVRKGDAGRAITLIAEGAPVDVRDDERWTPLMHAALRGNTGLVLILLSSGADPDAMDELGSTALMAAAVNGHLEVARALVDHGATLDLRSRTGHTARERAESYAKREVARYLRAQEALRAPLPDIRPAPEPQRARPPEPELAPSPAVAPATPPAVAPATPPAVAPAIPPTVAPAIPLAAAAPPRPTPSAFPTERAAPAPRFETLDGREIELISGTYTVVKGANLRAQPDTRAAKLGSLPPGTEVRVTGKLRNRNWYRLGKGPYTGWVFGTTIEPWPPLEGTGVETSFEPPPRGTLTPPPSLPASQPAPRPPHAERAETVVARTVEPAERAAPSEQLPAWPERPPAQARRAALPSAPAPLEPRALAGLWRRAAHRSCRESYLEVGEDAGRLSLTVHLAGEPLILLSEAPVRALQGNRLELGGPEQRRTLRLEGDVLLYSFQNADPVPYLRCPDTFRP